jgi:tellurium resistance protein TerD
MNLNFGRPNGTPTAPTTEGNLTTPNLRKGERVSLTKDNPNLDKIHVGLGWDTNQYGTGDYDLDASVFMLGANDKIRQTQDFVFFNNLQSPEGAIKHTGDNRTGDGDGDDEAIKVQLSKVPASVEKIVFVVTIYDAMARRQNFGQIENAFIRIDDEATGRVLMQYDLTEDYSSASSVIVGELYRHGAEWKFSAKGEGMKDEIEGVCRKYGVL